MTTRPEGAGARAYWFVGVTYDSDDQTNRFLSEGIWQNRSQDKYLDQVKSIQTGDCIAIKASSTRRHNFPFDNQGQRVSVMAIKATGTVKKNHGDGRTLDVKWKSFDPPREWYFSLNRSMLWCVSPGDWATDALIEFAFKETPQDIRRFMDTLYLRGRFGDISEDKRLFLWNRFYEAIADKLLLYRKDREGLLERIHSIYLEEGLSSRQDQFQGGFKGPLKDICPFTAMGIFNRGRPPKYGDSIPTESKLNIATKLATFLEVEEITPDSFEGIPVLLNVNPWIFDLDYKRKADDIDALWEIFAQAINFAESDNADVRTNFIMAFNSAISRSNVGWNLAIGLYWVRPWNFLTLDSISRPYIRKILNIRIGCNGPKKRYNATDYLAVLDTLEARFQEDEYPAHSFPELSYTARLKAQSCCRLPQKVDSS